MFALAYIALLTVVCWVPLILMLRWEYTPRHRGERYGVPYPELMVTASEEPLTYPDWRGFV